MKMFVETLNVRMKSAQWPFYFTIKWLHMFQRTCADYFVNFKLLCEMRSYWETCESRSRILFGNPNNICIFSGPENVVGCAEKQIKKINENVDKLPVDDFVHTKHPNMDEKTHTTQLLHNSTSRCIFAY